jgi:hypothetical protein
MHAAAEVLHGLEYAKSKWPYRPDDPDAIPALLILSKSIQGCLHNLQRDIHRGLLIVGNLIWQEVSNPYDSGGASLLCEDLK